jgi:hypothetical protein
MIVVGASPGGSTVDNGVDAVDSGHEVVNGLRLRMPGNDLRGLKFEILPRGLI